VQNGIKVTKKWCSHFHLYTNRNSRKKYNTKTKEKKPRNQNRTSNNRQPIWMLWEACFGLLFAYC